MRLTRNGGFLYTPTAGYHGPDGFTYRANDGTANSNVATASINVSQTALPTVSIAATTANANEAGPVNGLFTFTRSGGNTAAALTVSYVISGTASNGNDYASISTSISIPATQTSVTLPINVFKDNIVEPSETVILTIASSASYTVGVGTATVTIADDPPIVSIAATTANASEVGPVNGLFTFTRSGGNTAAALTVSYVISGTASNGNDYASISTSISIPATQTSVTLPINVFKDNIVEPSETVILTIASSASYTVGVGTATVTIADDPPIVSIAATTANASEVGPVNGLFTFTRSGGNTAAALTVSYVISGTASNGNDYASISTSISIPAAQTSVTLPINVFKDNIVEPSETVILTLSSSASYTIGVGTATVTIADDPPIVSIAATTANASEVGPVNGLFTFTRSGGNTAAALTVSYVISGTASNGNDYASISTSISIPAAQTSVTLPINVLQDNVVESTETVILTIQLSATYSIGTAAATVFITDAPSTADVQITKTVDHATPTVGQNVTFTVHALNVGPGVASGVVVQDLLPAGYTFVSKTASNGTYTESTGVWTVGSLSLNQTATLVVNATVKATGPYNNTATRTASTPTDPNATNDAATVTVTPVTTADVQMSVTVDNATPTVGQNVTFSIAALNAGPGVAQGIVVQDLLPSGYTFVSSGVFNGSYNATTGVWTVGDLTLNQAAHLNLVGTVKTTGSYNDTATRTASTPTDPNATNDTATVTVTTGHDCGRADVRDRGQRHADRRPERDVLHRCAERRTRRGAGDRGAGPAAFRLHLRVVGRVQRLL